MDDGVHEVFAVWGRLLPEIFVHVHFEFERHGDHSAAVFELADELLAHVFALLPLLTRRLL